MLAVSRLSRRQPFPNKGFVNAGAILRVNSQPAVPVNQPRAVLQSNLITWQSSEAFSGLRSTGAVR